MAEGAVGRRRPIRRTVRGPALTTAAIGLAGLMAAPAAAQRPPCADALHAGENALWDSAAFLAADLTLDGAADAVYWRADSARVVVLIGSCDGEEVAERWRLGFDLPADCP
ncbi:MAG: hypothetical protein R3314_12325, partial [Longimicrobiales bacterium]|nr:hypothetical protein [Longimicrobiales bacterium]